MTAVPAPAQTHEPPIGGWFWLWPPRGLSERAQALRALPLALARTLDRLAGHRTSRRVTLGVLEFGIALLAANGAVLVVYGGGDRPLSGGLLAAVALLVSAKVALGLFTGAFGSRWRYVGTRDALAIV